MGPTHPSLCSPSPEVTRSLDWRAWCLQRNYLRTLCKVSLSLVRCKLLEIPQQMKFEHFNTNFNIAFGSCISHLTQVHLIHVFDFLLQKKSILQLFSSSLNPI